IFFSLQRDRCNERLRDACADPALSAVDRRVYFDNMAAVTIELLNIAIIKSYGFDVSGDAHEFIYQYLRERGLGHIDSLNRGALTGIYHSAFGTPGNDGVACMVAAFSREVTGAKLRDDTMARLHDEFYAMLKIFFDDMKRIKLVATR